MKKGIARVLTLAGIVLLLGGCGAPADITSQPDTTPSASTSAVDSTTTAASATTTTKAPGKTAPVKTPPTTVHQHDFAPATCQAPKTCRSCGAVEGTKADHAVDVKTSRCQVCGAFVYTPEAALRGCLQQANQRNASYFDQYRILNVYYTTDDACLCDEKQPNKYLSMFIYFQYEIDGQTGYDLDVYDIHKGTDAYINSFSNLDVLYTHSEGDTITRIRTKDYSVLYEGDALKKAAWSQLLQG